MKAFFLKILLLTAIVAELPGARADMLVFDNGDKLSGTVVSQDSDNIRFNNPTLGVIVVPAAHAHIETATKEVAANSSEGVASNKQPESNAPVPLAPTLGDHIRQYVNDVVPGYVSGRLDAGVTNTRASSVTTQILSVGNITVKNGPNSYDLKGFYYYTATTDMNGVVNRSADRYGSDFTYNRDLSDRLFVNNQTGYLRDFQAGINQQARDILGAGYTVWKGRDVNLAFQAGPTEQYTDADGIADKWFTLGTGKQTLTWNITDLLRLEQEASAGAEPTNLNGYTWKVSAALINKIDRNLELSLRYSQSYNTLVGTNGTRSEQLLALALGLTF
jgi:putative salt-induced outer membrane protein YdiY